MKQVILAFIALNIAIGTMIAAALVGMKVPFWPNFISLEFAQGLGVMQALLLYTTWKNEQARKKI